MLVVKRDSSTEYLNVSKLLLNLFLFLERSAYTSDWKCVFVYTSIFFSFSNPGLYMFQVPYFFH